jgi:phage gpG-like protein
VKLKAKVIGSQRLRTKLRAVQAGLPAVVAGGSMRTYLLERIKARFLREEAPSGASWEARSPRTRQGPGILRYSEKLYKAIDVIGGTNEGSFALNTGAGFRIGVRGTGGGREDPSRYGRFHQYGTKKMTARPFLGLSKADEKGAVAKARYALRKLIG